MYRAGRRVLRRVYISLFLIFIVIFVISAFSTILIAIMMNLETFINANFGPFIVSGAIIISIIMISISFAQLFDIIRIYREEKHERE